MLEKYFTYKHNTFRFADLTYPRQIQDRTCSRQRKHRIRALNKTLIHGMTKIITKLYNASDIQNKINVVENK